MIFEDLVEISFIAVSVMIMVLAYTHADAKIVSEYESYQILNSFPTSFSILSSCFPPVIDVNNDTQIEEIRECIYYNGLSEKIEIETGYGVIEFKSKGFDEDSVITDVKAEQVSKFYYPIKFGDEIYAANVTIKKAG